MSEKKVQPVEEQVLFEKNGHIATITFNRPHARNALTIAGTERYSKLLDQVRDDPDIHVLVLKGAGDLAFCAGHDLKENAELPDVTDINERRAETNEEIELYLKLWKLPQPVVCSVSGYCVGMGICFALTSDYIIAADNAKFGELEASLGYAPEYAINPWVMSATRAKELSFFSELKTAEEMYHYNVVNKVVPLAELEEATNAVAKRLSEMNYNTVKMIKYQYNKTYEMMGFNNAIQFCQEVYNMHRQTMAEEMAEFNALAREYGFAAAVKMREEKTGVKYRQ